MARELGLNPKKIGSLANQGQEPWKDPLPEFIATMYKRRFGRRQPERVVSIEQRAAELAEKRASHRARRAGKPAAESRLRADSGRSERQPLGRGTHTTFARVSGSEMNVTREAATTVDCAAAQEARIISLGPLVFFSTATGDAWVLDPSHGLARCLARAGVARPSGIRETAESFAVEWEGTYVLSGDGFGVVDESGRTSTCVGSPSSKSERHCSVSRPADPAFTAAAQQALAADEARCDHEAPRLKRERWAA
jgi:hypothetical protein